MKRILMAAVLGAFTLVSTGLGEAAELFVFPKNAQTKEQQEQDEFACYKWAKEQTGFDPNKPVEQASAPAPPKVELSPELQRAQPSGPSVALSLEMLEKGRRSAQGSVRQAGPTKNEKAKNNKRRLSSKRHNSRRQAWMATNEPLEPVWKGKGTQ